MKLPFDPQREIELRVTPKDGPEQVYTLRFGMQALDAASRRMPAIGASLKLSNGEGVNKIVNVLSGDDPDALCGFLFLSMIRHHPLMTWAECWDLIDIDVDACVRARAQMLNLTLPEPDPKEPAEPAATPATTETSPEPSRT